MPLYTISENTDEFRSLKRVRRCQSFLEYERSQRSGSGHRDDGKDFPGVYGRLLHYSRSIGRSCGFRCLSSVGESLHTGEASVLNQDIESQIIVPSLHSDPERNQWDPAAAQSEWILNLRIPDWRSSWPQHFC